MVRDFAGKSHLMGDQQHGAPLRSQIPDHGQNFAHQFRVQGASGFVKEHHGWIYRQGAGDGGTLLLTT